MRALDRALQRWRFRVAMRHIPRGARVLDVGARGGELFEYLDGSIAPSVGIEPELSSDHRLIGPHELIKGTFPDDVTGGPFDCATLLAVVEHFDAGALPATGRALRSVLADDATVVVTVPSPLVDHILSALIRLRLLDGMDPEGHQGFSPKVLAPVWRDCGLCLVEHRRFQLGLNNLFVFRCC